MMYTVEPSGGLCNYLRVVFSYRLYCKREGKSLTVIWKVTDECPGFFLDYFEPIDDVIFLRENENILVDFYGNRWHPDYNPYAMYIYDGLKPLVNIQDKINSNKLQLGRYIAVHIRRTDHVWLAQAECYYTSDDEFINFIQQYANENLYISTDNRETQDKFYALFSNKIKVIEFIQPTGSLRQTSIEDAIIDIFTCIDSLDFKGSGFSTFSATIYQIREPIDSDKQFKKQLSY